MADHLAPLLNFFLPSSHIFLSSNSQSWSSFIPCNFPSSECRAEHAKKELLTVTLKWGSLLQRIIETSWPIHYRVRKRSMKRKSSTFEEQFTSSNLTGCTQRQQSTSYVALPLRITRFRHVWWIGFNLSHLMMVWVSIKALNFLETLWFPSVLLSYSSSF